MAGKTLTVTIVGDARGAIAAFKELDGSSDEFGKQMEKLGGKIAGFGAKLTVGVTLPLALLGKASFNAASDLTESMSKVDNVFDGSAGAIHRWSAGAAEDFGMSRQQAEDAAGSFGNMFMQLGFGGDKAAHLSKKMTELATDFASFHNADITEVIEAQSAAFRGEYDALQKFVPTINAAAVEQQALAETGKKSTAELTAGEKAAAVYTLMMQGAGDALGDYDRTADGAANKQRELTAKFEDAKAKIGDALVPIFQELAAVIAKAADWFSNLSPKVQKFAVYGGILLAVIGPLTTALGGLVTVIGVIASPITLIVVAVAAVVAAIVLMWLKWDEIWNFMKDHPAILLVVSILAAPVAALFLIVGAVKELYENWGTIWPQIQGVLETAWGAMKPVFGFLVDAYHFVNDALVFLSDQWAAIWPTIQAILEGAWTVMQAILEVAIPVAFDVVKGVLEVLQGVFESVWNMIGGIVTGAWTVIEPVLGFLKGRLDDIASAAEFMRGVVKGAFDGVVSAAEVLRGAVNGPINAMVDAFEAAYRAAKKLVDILPSIPNVSGPGGPSLGSQLESAGYGGQRALGGPTRAGLTYLVGEDGPELWTAPRAGQIIPNHQLAGAGGTTVQMYGDFTFPNVQTASDAQQIFALFKRMAS